MSEIPRIEIAEHDGKTTLYVHGKAEQVWAMAWELRNVAQEIMDMVLNDADLKIHDPQHHLWATLRRPTRLRRPTK